MTNNKNLLTIFFLWCSGVESDVLKQFPSEKQRYTSIGATIFFTSILAFLSGAYAFVLAFENKFLGISLGIMWSVLVFALDRYAIFNIAKSKSFFNTLLSSIPSLLIAIIITLVISTPILLKFFEKQIQLEYTEQIHQSIFSSNSEYNIQQELIQKHIHSLQDEILQKQIEVTNREKDFISEIEGNRGFTNQGYGPVASFKKSLFEEARRDYETVKIHNDSLTNLLNSQIISLNKEMRIREELSLSKMTFVDMIQTFSNLKQKNNTINLTSILIMLLFLFISIVPILIQILSREGPYNEYIKIRDRIQINTIENEKQIENKKLKSDINELSEKFEEIRAFDLNSITSESTIDKKKENHEDINFQSYFNNILNTLSSEANKIEKKTKDFFWQGMVFSIIGILAAFGLLVFWINYFSIHKFEFNDIFKLISGTTIILLIEFLGAWFLKQHKIFSEKSLYILKIKAYLDRYLLSYLAINEFASSNNKENYLNQLLITLDKDLRFPPDPSTSQDTSFAQEAFISISNLTDAIKNITKMK